MPSHWRGRGERAGTKLLVEKATVTTDATLGLLRAVALVAAALRAWDTAAKPRCGRSLPSGWRQFANPRVRHRAPFVRRHELGWIAQPCVRESLSARMHSLAASGQEQTVAHSLSANSRNLATSSLGGRPFTSHGQQSSSKDPRWHRNKS